MGFRVLLFDNEGSPLGELSQDAGTLLSCTRSEEINGEHSLTLSTERHLEVGTRALTRHADGRWREWVVDEPGETHDTGAHAKGTYHLCWSLQYDLQAVYGQIRELGMLTPATARQAMTAALSGTSRWSLGTCDVTETAVSVVMGEDSSAWDRLTTVVKYWGGEIDAEISVDDFGVTSRKVALLSHLGSSVATRRFEWGHDLTGITRTPDPGPYFCRVIPLGSGETEEAADGVTTYEVKLDISQAASFVDSERSLRHERGTRYIRDTESERVFRVSDGRGGWEYPSTVVTFSTDDLDDLVALAREDAQSHTRPGVSYSGSVANFSRVGMDTDGIQLGDEVQVLDSGFNPDAELRIQERILQMEIDEMGVEDAQITIGRLIPKLERTLATVTKTVGVGSVSYNAPVWDASKYAIATPTLSHYKVSTPSTGGVSYNVPTVSYDIPDYGSAISSLQSQVSAISSGDVSAVGGGDGIIHTLNGVELQAGDVVAFSTSGSFLQDAANAAQNIVTNMSKKVATAWGNTIKGSSKSSNAITKGATAVAKAAAKWGSSKK